MSLPPNISHIINSFYCSENDPKKGYVITLSFCTSLFYVFFIVSIITIYRVYKTSSQAKFSKIFFRTFFSVTLFLKASLLTLEVYGYDTGKELGAWKVIVLLLPGSVASIAYLVILYNWCGIYGNFIGGTREKVFKYVKILIAVLLIIFSTLFILFIILEILYMNNPEKFKTIGQAESINAIVRDTTSTILFLAFTIYIGRGLGISCKLCSGTQEQLIYAMSIAICVGYMIRVVTRVFYRIIVQSWKRSDCSNEFLYFYISKEMLGQCMPLGFVTFMDFLLIPSASEYKSVLDDEISGEY